MAKDILIYGYIGEYTARSFFEQVAKAEDDDEESLTFRINTDGGNPQMGFGMLNKMKEVDNKRVVVDGSANSFGAFACLYSDEVEAVDMAEFAIHRAAYPNWFEQNPDYFDDFERKRLAHINSKLEKAFRAKIDVEKFEKITGKTVDEIFSMESRITVHLTASQAKDCGLITSIVPLTPKRKQQIAAYHKSLPIEAKLEAEQSEKPEPKTKEKETPKNQNMTLAELRIQHPALVAEIAAEAEKAGIKKERDRVESIMVYASVDPKKAKELIEKGEELSAKAREEFQLAALTSTHLAKLSKDSAGEIKTGDDEAEGADEKTKKAQAQLKEIRANLGLKVA